MTDLARELNEAAALRAVARRRASGPRFDYCPHEPTPKQAEFLAADGLEVMYGGAAGGGKSDSLLMASLQYVHVHGYAALLLRRTYPDLALPGAIMDRAADWLRNTDARWAEKDKTWHFPSGASLTFGYLQYEKDKYRYQGAEFQFCVVPGTPVLMADGSWRPIESVRVGDLVETLEGPRKVTAVHSPGVRPVSRVATPYGEAVVGATHRLLTASGAWASPEELRPILSLPFDSTAVGSLQTPREPCTHAVCQSSGLPPGHGQNPRSGGGTGGRGSCACLAGAQSGCGGSDCECRESSPLRTWFGRLALLERALLSGATAGHEWPDASPWVALRGSPTGCPCGLRSGGVLPRHRSGADRDSTRQRVGVAGPCRCVGPQGGPGSTQTHTPRWYAHPYTMEERPCGASVRPVWARISPAGESEVLDLTVASASHYIVMPGIIARNCGFDEVTQFTETQYRYLLSRVRRLRGADVPLRVRCASNPGGIGHVWVKARFVDTETRGTRRFIPARLEDNPHLDAEEYEHSLAELDPVTRQQLREGDWSVRAPGGLFDRAWFTVLDHPPENVRARVVRWDLAATEATPGRDPDWTVGVVMSLTTDGMYVVEDVIRAQRNPGGVEGLLRSVAATYGPGVPIRIPQDPGQAGKAQAVYLITQVLAGYDVVAVQETGSKLTRARPFSAQAANGKVAVVRGHWLPAFFDELEAFPESAHDDQVDAGAGAFAALVFGGADWEVYDDD